MQSRPPPPPPPSSRAGFWIYETPPEHDLDAEEQRQAAELFCSLPSELCLAVPETWRCATYRSERTKSALWRAYREGFERLLDGFRDHILEGDGTNLVHLKDWIEFMRCVKSNRGTKVLHQLLRSLTARMRHFRAAERRESHLLGYMEFDEPRPQSVPQQERLQPRWNISTHLGTKVVQLDPQELAQKEAFYRSMMELREIDRGGVNAADKRSMCPELKSPVVDKLLTTMTLAGKVKMQDLAQSQGAEQKAWLLRQGVKSYLDKEEAQDTSQPKRCRPRAEEAEQRHTMNIFQGKEMEGQAGAKPWSSWCDSYVGSMQRRPQTPYVSNLDTTFTEDSAVWKEMLRKEQIAQQRPRQWASARKMIPTGRYGR